MIIHNDDSVLVLSYGIYKSNYSKRVQKAKQDYCH